MLTLVTATGPTPDPPKPKYDTGTWETDRDPSWLRLVSHVAKLATSDTMPFPRLIVAVVAIVLLVAVPVGVSGVLVWLVRW